MRNSLFTLAVILFVLPFGAQAAVVNINTASAAQLDALPGIGPSKAAAIIDYRTAHGPFAKIEDIVNVKGIGPSTYDGLKGSITIEDVSTPVQPSPPPARSTTQQPVETAVAQVSEPAHAQNAVDAPEVTSQLAASGAAPQVQTFGPNTPDLLNSVWTMAFLGVLLLGGAALLIL